MGLGIKIGVMAGQGFSNNFSLSFDGTNDQVTLPLSQYTSDFTFSFWIKPSSIDPADNRFIIGKVSDPNHYIHLVRPTTIALKINGSLINFTTSDGDGGNPIVLNEWNNIIVTRGSSSTVKAFRNGTAFGEATGSLAGTLDVSYLGGDSSRHYLGLIDEVAIWSNSDQSTNAIKIYNSGVPNDLVSTDFTSPSTWYRFEEGSGTTANNSISEDGAGTISGATYTIDTP
tara:strand:- start:145 stop:828 length:684 start_codon:yes stop_codon:yes gene_type:complete